VAAEQSFASSGFHDVKMDDVARACGVGKGTLYRYFPGKRELYQALLLDGVDRLHADLRAELARGTTPIRTLERMARCVLAHFWERRLSLPLLQPGERPTEGPEAAEWMRRRSELVSLLQRGFEEAITADQIQAVDPRLTAELLLGMLRGATRFRAEDAQPETALRAILDTLVCGVGTASGRRLASVRRLDGTGGEA
jgi:TetR/AcrR family fatty acid metabolism transcriptional regulator